MMNKLFVKMIAVVAFVLSIFGFAFDKINDKLNNIDEAQDVVIFKQDRILELIEKDPTSSEGRKINTDDGCNDEDCLIPTEVLTEEEFESLVSSDKVKKINPSIIERITGLLKMILMISIVSVLVIISFCVYCLKCIIRVKH